MSLAGTFRQLGLVVLERGWLSSNNIVFGASRSVPATVVDTGYDAHATQTFDLVRTAAGRSAPERIVNTHLHSDHCGGNHTLQARLCSCETWVPEASFDAAAQWDESRLSFRDTGQTCRRFSVDRGLAAGETVELGAYRWNVVHAPGHDPQAIMLFEPKSRTLISADALWQSRLAIIFPEIDGEPGFADSGAVLDTIERLEPAIVIPGHGSPFTDCASAVRISRERLSAFVSDSSRHLRYATRALVMFRMMELRRCERGDLVRWLIATPIFRRLLGRGRLEHEACDLSSAARELVSRLIGDGLLVTNTHDQIALP